MWNGSWWEPDRLEQVPELASKTIDGLRAWVGEARSDTEFKRRSRHYQSSTGSPRRDGMLKLARSSREVVVGVEELDQFPMLLACHNGVVNLESGSLNPASRELLITRGVDLDYDPETHSEAWERFLITIFQGDEGIDCLRAAAPGLLRDGIDHRARAADPVGKWGEREVNADRRLAGPLGRDGNDCARRTTHHPPRRPAPRTSGRAEGPTLAVSDELEKRAVLAEQTVKVLTGGDIVSAREMYGRRFDFVPTHKLVVCSNHTPKVRGTDIGIWRRLRLVPFNVTIPPEDQDPHLRESLVREHGQAILAWLVRGAIEWNRDGLGTTPAVAEATERYRNAQDVVATFLAETTVPITGRTKVGQLWDCWRKWCEQSGESPRRKQDFSASLEEHGLELETYQGTRFVREIGLREGS